jgi:mannose-6-phosphate isomerase-like protein (cupin superfamily)
MMRAETRPWGRFEVIYESPIQWLKRIIITPGQSLSYQYHRHRTEHWLAETDGAWAELDGYSFPLLKAVSYTASPGRNHRLFNPCAHEVSVLEWATGSPDETDIIRIRDDYGRK